MNARFTLTKLRLDKNLKQKDMAELLNVSTSTISMYETGKRTPPLITARKIAKLFNVSVDTIVYGSEDRGRCQQQIDAIAL